MNNLREGRQHTLTSRRFSVLIGTLCWLLFAPLAVAADAETPLAPLDQSSPQATVDSVLRQASRIETAMDAYSAEPTRAGLALLFDLVRQSWSLFELDEIPLANRAEVAGASFLYLLDIFNRLPPESLELPPLDGEDPAAWPERVRLPGTEIVLVRAPQGPNQFDYLFSAKTVSRLPAFHRRIIDQPPTRETTQTNWHRVQMDFTGPWIPRALVDAMPGPLQEPVFGTPLWKALLVVLLGVLALWIVKIWRRVACNLALARPPVGNYALRLTIPLLFVLLALGLGVLVQTQINLAGSFALATQGVFVFALFVAAAWSIWLGCFLVVEWIISSPTIPDQSYDAHLLRLLAQVLGVIGVGAVVVYGLNSIGLPVLGLVTGVGIGGIALALAAQSTIENLFGGINVFADRPFRVGDFIKYGSDVGTVEQVGPRSSRIRGVDGALTTVPNAGLSSMHITNLTRRDKCLFSHVFGLRYETNEEQIHWLLAKLQASLAAHELVDVVPGMPRVRLVAFGASSIDIEARAYVLTSDYGVFLEVQQALLLSAMRLITEAGTGFAFPSQTTYIAKDAKPDPSRLPHTSGIPEPTAPKATASSHASAREPTDEVDPDDDADR